MFDTIKKGLVLFLGLLAIAVLAFNSYGVEPCLRLALANAEKRTGTKVDFTSASGNVLTGSLAVNGIEIAREVDGRNAFKLDIAHLTADLSVLRMFDPTWQFDQLHLLGVKGDFRVVERSGGEGSRLSGGNIFNARHVLMTNGDVTFTNHRDGATVAPMKVEVDSLTVDEYRSDWSLYDLLFRSTLVGKVDGEPFTFARQQTEGKQLVTWDLKGLPLAKWGKGWTSAALGLAGDVDVVVVSSWPVEKSRDIAQDWTVARRGGPTLKFQSQMLEGSFLGAQSLEEAGLGKVIREGLGAAAVGGLKSGVDKLRERLFGVN